MTEPDPEIVTAPRGTLLRGAWAFPDDLDERRRKRLGDDEWREVLLAASELLYAYSGRLYAGTFTDRAEVVDQRSHVPQHLGALGRPGFRPLSRFHPSRVRLPGDPVVEILGVTDQGAALTTWLLEQPDRVVRTDGRGFRPGTVVTFRHGLAPPEAGVQAAMTYAYELARARTSDGGCRLPEAVQNVTRQGVSYTVVDRANEANRGRTGLPEVDQWLQAVNPMIGSGSDARPRRGAAMLLSPDLPPRARLLPRDPQ